MKTTETAFDRYMKECSRSQNDLQELARTLCSSVARKPPPPCDSVRYMLVSWKGISVHWFHTVFLQTPEMQQCLAFGCRVWFIRNYCIIEMLRSRAVEGGCLIDHIDKVGDSEVSSNKQTVDTATAFISFTGSYSLELFAELMRHESLKDKYIWTDMLCVNQFQWTNSSSDLELVAVKTDFMRELRRQISLIGFTALFLDRWDNWMSTLGNIWVLWEIFATVGIREETPTLHIVFQPSEETKFLQEGLGTFEGYERINSTLTSIDVSKAKAYHAHDETMIFDLMKEEGVFNVSSRVAETVRIWLTRTGEAGLQRKTSISPNLKGNMAILYEHLGEFPQAEHLLKELVKTQGSAILGDQERYLSYTNQLGSVLAKLGRFEEAKQLHSAAFHGRQKLLGETNEDTLSCRDAFANVLQQQSKYSEAEPHLRELLEIRHGVLRHNHPDIATSCSNLADLLKRQCQAPEAELLHRKALRIREAEFGESHPDVWGSMSNLAGVLDDQKKFPEAEALHQKALKGFRIAFGEYHPHTLAALNNLGASLSLQGRADEAENLHRTAFERRRSKLGKQHPATFRSLDNLVQALWKRGKRKEAEELCRGALPTKFDEELLCNHPEAAFLLYTYASIQSDSGTFEWVEKLHHTAYHHRVQQLGAFHRDTLNSLNSLAIVQSKRGAYTEAELRFREIWKTRIATLGEDHPETVISMSNLAAVLQDQRKFTKAEALYRRVLELRRLRHGNQHTAVLSTMSDLGKVLRGLGNLGEAEELLQGALHGLTEKLGSCHPDTLDCAENMAALRVDQENFQAASSLKRDVWEGHVANCGPEHEASKRAEASFRFYHTLWLEMENDEE